MDEALEYFKAFTGAQDDIAKRYLGLTEYVPEQAIQLFFDSPDLASSFEPASSVPTPNLPNATQSRSGGNKSRRLDVDVINLDSDDAIDVENDAAKKSHVTRQATTVSRTVDIENDESIARRIQAEIYEGKDPASVSHEVDSVRAPMERRREVLVSGGWQDEDIRTGSFQQMRSRTFTRPGLGVFNQAPVPSSIWESNADPSVILRGLSQATGGASETSPKAARLAELFRPPFEIMHQVPWESAREQGKEEKKWIMVNVQDQSIFDCQQLNRDIWKDPGIKEAIREHFIFVQYSKEDPRGSQYLQFYFQNKDNSAAYPHISIVDPRTGEQVKIWSGRPVPLAADFLMQIYEFLDRYSLDHTKKNPIATRKLESLNTVINVDQLTEEEMLGMALQNSLEDSKNPEQINSDGDDLAGRPDDNGKGKGKEVAGIYTETEEIVKEASSSDSPFAQISSSNFHTQPPSGPETTRIQFKHASGRVVRVFNVRDTVRRIYEWLKSDPLQGRAGIEFELKCMGKNLISHLDESIEDCGLKNGTVMIEFLESDE